MFAFLPELVKSFLKVLKISESDRIIPERPELLPAIGAALYNEHNKFTSSSMSIQQMIDKLKEKHQFPELHQNRIQALFKNDTAFSKWTKKNKSIKIKKIALETYNDYSAVYTRKKRVEK